jgi:CRP/FNR family transcriptional regulator, cyclic AMP receptor protein
MTMRTVACGTDFSPSARAAANVAVRVAEHARAELLLVHVCDDPGGSEVLALLDAEAQRLRSAAPGLEVKTLAVSGFQDQILTHLDEHGLDLSPSLLVVGSVGRRGVAEEPLGATAERTVRLSRVPVLVVRDPTRLINAPESALKLEVVVGDDLSGMQGLLSEVARWLPTHERRITLCHVAAAETVGSRDHARLLSDLREQAQNASPAEANIDCQVIPNQVSRAQTLADLAEKRGASLLVLGARAARGPERLWEETVTRGALYRARTNVLIVPLGPAHQSATPTDSGVPLESTPTSELLEAHPFAGTLPGHLRAILIPITTASSFESGQLLFREGSPADSVFLLLEGKVGLDIQIPGKPRTRVATLGSGDWLGFSWLFPPFRWHFDAVALDRVHALRIDAQRFREMLDQNPELDRLVSKRLVRELYARLERTRLQTLDIFQASGP